MNTPDRQALSILATFAHEVLMGAISDPELQDRAELALKRAGFNRFADVVALAGDGGNLPLPLAKPLKRG